MIVILLSYDYAFFIINFVPICTPVPVRFGR